MIEVSKQQAEFLYAQCMGHHSSGHMSLVPYNPALCGWFEAFKDTSRETISINDFATILRLVADELTKESK
jgi:hypothetical protein